MRRLTANHHFRNHTEWRVWSGDGNTLFGLIDLNFIKLRSTFIIFQEEFIFGEQLNGEEGYALANVEVAVEYITTSDIIQDHIDAENNGSPESS